MAEANPITDELADSLRVSLRGEIIQPTDDGYDEARAVYNAMIDRHPRLFARDNGVIVSVRGGSHNAAGLGVVDDGLVIDLSTMKGIHWDAGARTVRVAGGATWGDVDHATHAYGLATPSGIL